MGEKEVPILQMANNNRPLINRVRVFSDQQAVEQHFTIHALPAFFLTRLMQLFCILLHFSHLIFHRRTKGATAE